MRSDRIAGWGIDRLPQPTSWNENRRLNDANSELARRPKNGSQPSLLKLLIEKYRIRFLPPLVEKQGGAVESFKCCPVRAIVLSSGSDTDFQSDTPLI